MPALPAPRDFRSPTFLRGHVLQTLGFYDGRCVDPSGGFFHSYRDDGRIDDHKNPPGKTDYHTIGACLDLLEVQEMRADHA